jgi:hypothetical protein
VTQIVDQLFKGRLSPQQYISTQPFDFRVPAERVIVFIVGGATYVEAKELESLNNVILGSTNLINSAQFIDQVTQLSRIRRDDAMLNFEIN